MFVLFCGSVCLCVFVCVCVRLYVFVYLIVRLCGFSLRWCLFGFACVCWCLSACVSYRMIVSVRVFISVCVCLLCLSVYYGLFKFQVQMPSRS